VLLLEVVDLQNIALPIRHDPMTRSGARDKPLLDKLTFCNKIQEKAKRVLPLQEQPRKDLNHGLYCEYKSLSSWAYKRCLAVSLLSIALSTVLSCHVRTLEARFWSSENASYLLPKS